MMHSHNLRMMGRWIALIVLSLMLHGCNVNFPATVRGPVELTEDSNGNFVFYVSNQSFAESKVDIQVLIDGKVAVDHNFRVGDQHNWREFVFNLSQGKHTLKAVSIKGKAQLETEFTVGEKNWAGLDYWYSPKNKEGNERQFTFHIQDEQILFL